MSSLTHQTKAPQQLESLITTPACITDNIQVWTSAIKTKSATGRGSSKKRELYGIKKLRELILELAVRGKLVPQDPTDEPASVLLERIAAEKAELIKQGKIKKSKNYDLISDLEKNFDIPNNWLWVRINELGHDLGQKKPDTEFTYIDVGSIDKTLGKIQSPSMITASDAPSRARKIVKEGTVIYSTIRPYLLNIAVVDSDINPQPIASTAFAILHPFKGVSSHYIYYFLRSPLFVNYVESVQTGIAYPAINDKQFFSGVFPLPPEKEQQRIVVKVNELMALCDQLESETDASIEAHQTLVTTLLTTLTDSQNADELMQNWALISAHFDLLFTTEQSIEQLKQSILQLAVMGKLVPQDPNDEPAFVLLERIAAEKAQLVKQGKIKKQKPLPAISEDEKPFALPKGWEWSQLSELTEIAPRNTEVSDDTNVSFVPMPLISTHHSGKHQSEKRPWSEIKKGYTHFANGDIAIAKITPCFENSKAAVFSGLFNNIGAGTTELHVARPIKNTINPYFVLLYLKAPIFLKIGQTKMTGSAGQKRLPKEFFAENPLPLPPEKEQHRIVAKVNELMALCDAMKSKLQTKQQTQLSLADALIANSL